MIVYKKYDKRTFEILFLEKKRAKNQFDVQVYV